MARRRRRRRSVVRSAPRRRRRRRVVTTNRATRRRRRHRRNAVTFLNPRRRRRGVRRRFRRNPSFSVRGITRKIQEAAVTGAQIVAGKVATRYVRNFVPGGKPTPGAALTWMQVLIELAAATAVGYVGEMVMGARAGANLMAGGYAGVIESLIKKYGADATSALKPVSDALGDDGDPCAITVPASYSGYVRQSLARASVSGYVQDSGFINGPGLGEPPGASGLIEDDSGVFADVSF